MSENEQRKVFSKNLNRYLDYSGKTQKEVAGKLNAAVVPILSPCRRF